MHERLKFTIKLTVRGIVLTLFFHGFTAPTFAATQWENRDLNKSAAAIFSLAVSPSVLIYLMNFTGTLDHDIGVSHRASEWGYQRKETAGLSAGYKGDPAQFPEQSPGIQP